jgi:hypothetical protein
VQDQQQALTGEQAGQLVIRDAAQRLAQGGVGGAYVG